MSLATTVGWRIPHPVPAPVGNAVDTVNGTGTTATPVGVMVGDALVLITMHNGAAIGVGSWGSTMVNTTDSSGAIRFQAFGRIADGTAADIASITGGGQTNWAMLKLRNMQAGELAAADSVAFAPNFTTPAINKVGSGTGNMAVITAAVIDAPAGGATFSAYPSGYSPFKAPDGTDRPEVNFTFDSGGAYFGRLGCVYKLVASGHEDPGVFGVGNNQFGGGGGGSMTIGLWYTPP